MNSRLFLPLALACAMAGCATYSDAELAQIRAHGLRPALVGALEHRDPLLPDALIELKRAGMSDEQIIRHLDKAGVDYVVTRDDVLRLRRAGLRPAVIDALLLASNRFAARHSYSDYEDAGVYDPLAPRFYGDWAFGFGAGF
jgi:hypothetical protein